MRKHIFLINYFNKAKTFSGYAYVAALGAHQALVLLCNQGRYAEQGYKLIGAKEVGILECWTDEIIFEGSSPDGLNAYEIAVRNGFVGTVNEWLKSLVGPQGDSLYDVAVANGYKGTEEQWIRDLLAGNISVFVADDDIPEDAMSTAHGNLPATTKAELNGLTVNSILSKILFADTPASISYGTNTAEAKENLEVGSSYSRFNFMVIPAVVNYKYPVGSKEWIVEEYNLTGTVKFGSFEAGYCLFKFTPDEITLKTAYGKESSLKFTTQFYNKTVYMTGFYNIGWAYGSDKTIPTDFTVSQITAAGTYGFNTTTSTPYIYLALPTAMTLTDFKVLDPLDKTLYNSVANFEKVQENVTLSLSSLNKYNIWRAGKASNNDDDTPTPNNAPIKITIQ